MQYCLEKGRIIDEQLLHTMFPTKSNISKMVNQDFFCLSLKCTYRCQQFETWKISHLLDYTHQQPSDNLGFRDQVTALNVVLTMSFNIWGYTNSKTMPSIIKYKCMRLQIIHNYNHLILVLEKKMLVHPAQYSFLLVGPLSM